MERDAYRGARAVGRSPGSWTVSPGWAAGCRRGARRAVVSGGAGGTGRCAVFPARAKYYAAARGWRGGGVP